MDKNGCGVKQDGGPRTRVSRTGVRYLFSVVGRRCRDALILAEEPDLTEAAARGHAPEKSGHRGSNALPR